MKTLLGGISIKNFLEDYWQKKPYLIRNAVPHFQSPLSADELAGLACEEGVSSRLIIEKDGATPWQVIYGPLEETIFSTLPASHWTLLVSDVEKLLPELAGIIDKFRFIPDWRIDDLMISYAPNGGSVGPHVDEYDVFLLQAEGHRRWQINTEQVSDDNFVPGLELRIMKQFNVEHEWVLAPGDLLYLPPGIAHYGMALDDCMTYSIGFRAPSYADMMVSFVEHLSESIPKKLRYGDPNLSEQENPGEITPGAINQVKEALDNILRSGSNEFIQWFGCYITESKVDVALIPEDGIDNVDVWLQDFRKNRQFTRHPASRFAYITVGDHAQFFVDGESYKVQNLFAQRLCRERCVHYEENLVNSLTQMEKVLLLNLHNQGKIYFEHEQ